MSYNKSRRNCDNRLTASHSIVFLDALTNRTVKSYENTPSLLRRSRQIKSLWIFHLCFFWTNFLGRTLRTTRSKSLRRSHRTYRPTGSSWTSWLPTVTSSTCDRVQTILIKIVLIVENKIDENFFIISSFQSDIIPWNFRLPVGSNLG